MACTNEVLLDDGDGMLDAGSLTRCKDAVCFLCINTALGMKYVLFP